MKIAVDGGAFQQGIAGGIYNVAVGLLNEMTRLAPKMSFVLVTDPRLGPPRPDLLQALTFEPELVEAPVGPAYGSSAVVITKDPHVAFEIDGRLVPAEVDDKVYRYRGAVPRRMARIRSRVEQPSASGSLDTRHLGLGIREIRVRIGGDATVVAWNDPRLGRGFHPHDASLCWTSGAATLPQDLFDADGDEVLIEVVAPGHLDYHFKSVSSRVASEAVARAANMVEVALLEQRLIALGCSAFLANHFIPISFRRLMSYAILYDVLPVKFPEFFLGNARQNFEHGMRVFRRADHCFSISETSRNDLIEVSDVSPDHVTTINIDIDPRFQPASRQAIDDVKRRYGLAKQPYILCVGTIEPRKNHHRLLRAFLEARARSTHTLAVVGKRGWGVDAFFAELEATGTTADVRVLADVPNEHLPMLYSGASLLAYPSLYEGFGLPIVEAMACGCPVLTSNLSSMAEIAEGAAVLVDPRETRDITAGLDRLASSGKLQAELRAKGLERRARFSWAKSAARVIEVLGL